MPQVEVGTKTQFKDLNATRKFTQPPRRYNEADLVRELEKRGIGRPSTYADIVSTLQKRGYARLEKKRFVIERLGEVVCMRLEDSFPELMNYGFTADMEKRLDGVASGKIHWRALLDEFYKGFRERLEQAADPEIGMKSLRQILTEIECTECSRPMSLRLGSSGLFLGCSGYRRKDEKDDSGEESCKSTQNLAEVARIVPGQQEESQATEGDSKGAAEPEIILPRQCERCGQSALVFQLDQARRLWVCGRSPDCDWTQVEHGNFAASAASAAATKLAIHLKDLPSRKYPDDYYILREGRNGLFLAAAGWPKHKEARNILVSELPLAGGQLGDKYAYLLSAPAVDPQDRPTEVCFSRKSKTQYIRTAELGERPDRLDSFLRQQERQLESDGTGQTGERQQGFGRQENNPQGNCQQGKGGARRQEDGQIDQDPRSQRYQHLSQEHSFLTNRLLGRSRCLAEAAANLPDPRPNLAAAAVELDRAVCSLMAEILDASPQQSRAMILGGHFALELGRIDDPLPGELEELRLLRAEPAASCNNSSSTVCWIYSLRLPCLRST